MRGGGPPGAAAFPGAARARGPSRLSGLGVWASSGCTTRGSELRAGPREAPVPPSGARAGGQRPEGRGRANWPSLTRRRRRSSLLSDLRPSAPEEVRKGGVRGWLPSAGGAAPVGGGGNDAAGLLGGTAASLQPRWLWSPESFSVPHSSNPKQGDDGSLAPKHPAWLAFFFFRPLSSFSSEGFCLPLERNQLKKKKERCAGCILGWREERNDSLTLPQHAPMPPHSSETAFLSCAPALCCPSRLVWEKTAVRLCLSARATPALG